MLNDTAKNLMLTELKTVVLYVSLHSGYPCTDINEISGGAPAYARKSVTFGTPATGSMSATNQPVFDVPAGTTVAGVGFYNLASAGTLYGDFDVTDEAFAGQGTYTITSATIDLNK